MDCTQLTFNFSRYTIQPRTQFKSKHLLPWRKIWLCPKNVTANVTFRLMVNGPSLLNSVSDSLMDPRPMMPIFVQNPIRGPRKANCILIQPNLDLGRPRWRSSSQIIFHVIFQQLKPVFFLCAYERNSNMLLPRGYQFYFPVPEVWGEKTS